MSKIYLASGSPRRKEFLKQIGLKFKVVPNDYQEDMTLDMKPSSLATFLSEGKAMSVSEKIKEGIIIAADTFVVLNDEILGKPHTPGKAKETLTKISGQVLFVITGLTVYNTSSKQKISKAVKSKIFVKNLSQEEIDSYIATGEPLDKAGAFAVQGRGVVFIKKIEGDYSNVVGLPLFELSEILKRMDVV